MDGVAASERDRLPVQGFTGTPEEIERQWYEKVYRGRGDSMRQLTWRAVIMGSVLGGVLSLTNLYIGLKAGWGFGVAITACILSYAIWTTLHRVGVVGTHNFDPRGDHYNTESAVVIEDPQFAAALADSIRRDIAPENAWVIAPREKAPVFSGLEYSIGKASEYLPLFDLWPVRYATSYEFVPGPQCPAPLPIDHARFLDCYRAVGDFP